jgi:uncharacterized protein (TIGR02466 family)
MNSNIIDLFSIPISVTNINRSFNNFETTALNLFESAVISNEGNKTSVDTNVIFHPALSNICEFIEQSLENYINNTIKPSESLDFFITQSWINFSKNGDWHHEHSHGNSILSGVFYFEADREKDLIIFSNERNLKKQIQIVPAEWNLYNCGYWPINVGTGDLIIFPSDLPHHVPKIITNRRVSLSFNTFIKGPLGNERKLNYLTI